MINDYFDYLKCISDLTSVLSFGYHEKFSYKALEKRICESEYFSSYNSSLLKSKLYSSSNGAISEIFFEFVGGKFDEPHYDELEWVATLYVYIINKTDFSFETIFIYLGIESAIKMYKLYHEMDFETSYKYFMSLKADSSIINEKMKDLHLTNSFVAKQTGLSLSMINLLRNRQRDIKKLDVYHALKLSSTLKIEIETLLNN